MSRAHGFETIGDVEQSVLDGDYQLWAGERSACITEIRTYPRRKVLAVIHGGGDLHELLKTVEPAMCGFALANGCDGVMGMGRKGWDRALKDNGYEFGWIMMVKDLHDGQ